MTSLYENGQLLQENFHNGLGCRMGSSIYAENLSEVSYGIDYADPFKRRLTESHADGIKREYLWKEDTLLGIPQDGVHVLTDLFHTPVRTAGKDRSSDSIWQYDEDGMLSQSDGTYALPFGYTGYMKESMDGLYYTGSRSYSAQDGRFMSRDQYRYMDYKNPATLNLYAYAWNNPLRYFDFDGHESIGEKSYLERSLEMVVLGNFSEESTLLGLAGGIVLSAFGGDIVMDVRDLVADLTVNADPTSLAWWGTIVLDIAAFVPLAGVVKYFDDVVDVFKKAFKAVDGKIDDILKASKKYLSSAKSGLESLTKKLGDIGNTVWNSAQDGWNRLMKVFKKSDSGKPNQVHHFATNKSKKYTSQFENITKKYGLDLDDDWNKALMPHQGRHPYAYHDYVLDNMQRFDRIANGDKTKFLKLYEQMKKKIINNPDMLYKDYWKKK